MASDTSKVSYVQSRPFILLDLERIVDSHGPKAPVASGDHNDYVFRNLPEDVQEATALSIYNHFTAKDEIHLNQDKVLDVLLGLRTISAKLYEKAIAEERPDLSLLMVACAYAQRVIEVYHQEEQKRLGQKDHGFIDSQLAQFISDYKALAKIESKLINDEPLSDRIGSLKTLMEHDEAILASAERAGNKIAVAFSHSYLGDNAYARAELTNYLLDRTMRNLRMSHKLEKEDVPDESAQELLATADGDFDISAAHLIQLNHPEILVSLEQTFDRALSHYTQSRELFKSILDTQGKDLAENVKHAIEGKLVEVNGALVVGLRKYAGIANAKYETFTRYAVMARDLPGVSSITPPREKELQPSN